VATGAKLWAVVKVQTGDFRGRSGFSGRSGGSQSTRISAKPGFSKIFWDS
jgi:hypothetical protein